MGSNPSYPNNYGPNTNNNLFNQVDTPDKKFEFFPEAPGGGEQAPALALVSINITPVNATLATLNTLQYAATGVYNDNTTLDLTSAATWTSSDNTLATIDSDGLATGGNAGSVTISARVQSITGSTGLTTEAPLTIVSYQDTGFQDTDLSISLPLLTWQTGDTFVIIGQTLFNGGPFGGSPLTGTSLTFNYQAIFTSPVPCFLATAIATSSDSGIISCSHNGSNSILWGVCVWQIRNGIGVGSFALGATGNGDPGGIVSLTSLQANSAIFWLAADQNSHPGGEGVNTVIPTPTTTRLNNSFGDSNQYAVITADLIDQPLTTSVNYGFTSSLNQYNNTVLACEIFS